MLETLKIFVIFTSLLGITLGQLTITSNEVDYTDGTYYSPFGTRVSLLCQGGSGAMNWQGVAFDQRSNITTTTTSSIFQRPAGDSQELVITSLSSSSVLPYFCQDVEGSLPEVQVEIKEGVIITSVLSSSTSVTLQWSPVQGASTLLTAASCVSPDGSSPVTVSTTLNTGSVTITGLEEFITYLCLLLSDSRNVQIKTRSDKPSGPPLNANLSAVNMDSVNLTWNLPSELDRNGLILSYSVQCLGEGIPEDTRTTEQTSMPFSGLQPGSIYSCRVAASTVNGTGPYSAFSNTTTQEGMPGPVADIVVMKLDNNRVDVSWGLPSPTNGVITSYQLKYRSLDGTVQEQNSSTRTQEISGLDPGVPYSLVVVASTSAGPGEDSQPVVFFSRELAPSAAVSDVVAERESADVMRVSWPKLSLIEARGFPVYNVLYQVTVGRVSRQSVMSVNATANTTTIGGLEGSEDYSVTVMASTEGGSGPQSEAVTVPVFVPPPTMEISSTPNPSTTAVIAAIIVAVIIVAVISVILAVVVAILIIYKCKTKGLYNMDHTGQYSTAVSLAASRERESLSTEPEAPDLLPPKEPPRPGSIGLETGNGHLAGNSEEKKDTPDEDEILEAAIDSIVVPNTDKERNLETSV